MILGITAQKGGVGKSTVSICLAVAALEQKQTVLLVDADPQGTIRTWAEVAKENGHQAPKVVEMGEEMHEPDQLPKLASQYDTVIIDGPPRHGSVQRSILMIADKIVLPCGPSTLDAWALADTLGLIDDARRLKPDIDASILINRVKRGTAIGKGARGILKEANLPVLKTELGDRVAYQEAMAAGQGVTSYVAKHIATTEIKSLYKEIGI